MCVCVSMCFFVTAPYMAPSMLLAVACTTFKSCSTCLAHASDTTGAGCAWCLSGSKTAAKKCVVNNKVTAACTAAVGQFSANDMCPVGMRAGCAQVAVAIFPLLMCAQ